MIVIDLTNQERTKSERIARLRQRLKSDWLKDPQSRELVAIIKGVLDLLEDEL